MPLKLPDSKVIQEITTGLAAAKEVSSGIFHIRRRMALRTFLVIKDVFTLLQLSGKSKTSGQWLNK